MSKRIPPVRIWCVRYWQGDTIAQQVLVTTINKRFAKWMAREQAGHPDCDRVTVYPVAIKARLVGE